MTAWGHLSTAQINRLILAGARRSDRMDVIAVASRNRLRAKAYAREHSIEQAYGSYDASTRPSRRRTCDDALGQARVIEALYQSAGSQRGTGAPNDVLAGR